MNKNYLDGFGLLEIVVSLLLITTALLGYIDLQAKTISWQHDSQQQYQAQLAKHNAQQ